LPYSILIADDNALIRHSLRACIEQNGNWEVCGDAENGKIAVERVKELHPDIVILDFQMPVMDGLEAARQISRLAPNTAMLMFTMYNSTQLVKEAQAVGIKDVLSKSEEVSVHLLASLNKVCGATRSMPR
jgi:DNA-binding NarL/FixJ family response regulator